MSRSYQIVIGDKAIYLPEEAFDNMESLFSELENNPTAMVDWETMKIVPNNPPPIPRDIGDRTPEDYEHKEGKRERNT